MAARNGIDRQLIDLPGPPGHQDLVVFDHGHGANQLGAQLRESINGLPRQPRTDRAAAELDYGNVMGALVEIGRHRDSLALAMFPTTPLNSENVDDYLTAATHIFTQANAIQREKLSEPRRLHSFMGPLSIGARRMHTAIATADPTMEDLPLAATTLMNLYETIQRYVRVLETNHLVPEGLLPRVTAAHDALAGLARATTVDARTVTEALAPSAALIPALPRHNPALDLAENEKTYGAAHRDRGREVVDPLAAALGPHVPADVDARLVAARVAETHADPFVALRVTRDLSAGMTDRVSFKAVLQRLAGAKTAAQRKAGLAAERETAIALLRAMGRAEHTGEAVSAVEKPAAPSGWPHDPHAPSEYSIDSEDYWREVTEYRTKFFNDLTRLTETLGDREAIKSALTDRWTRTITPPLVAAFVDDMGGRLVRAEVTAQQLAGVHLRMANPKSRQWQELAGVAYGRLADEILTAHESVAGLKNRTVDLAAMSFDVLGETSLDAELGGIAQSVQWKAPSLGRRAVNPESALAESPLARISGKLLQNFDWSNGKVVDPYRLGRYFGYVAAARHRPLPTEGEAVAGELWRRVELARDGANLMLHAGRLHPASVEEVSRRVHGLIDDMETLTLARAREVGGSSEIVHRSWTLVRRQLDHLEEPRVDPTSSAWRHVFEDRIERGVKSCWRKPPRPAPRGTTAKVQHCSSGGTSRTGSSSTRRRQPPPK